MGILINSKELKRILDRSTLRCPLCGEEGSVYIGNWPNDVSSHILRDASCHEDITGDSSLSGILNYILQKLESGEM